MAQGGCQTDSRTAPAGRSARPPAPPWLIWASILQPSPWGALACHCSKRTQLPLPLPAPQPLQGALPVTAAHAPCRPDTCRPAPLTDSTCREHEANPAPVPQGPEASSAAQAPRTTPKGVTPHAEAGEGKAAISNEHRIRQGVGEWIWRVGLRRVPQNSASGVLIGKKFCK